MRTMEGSPAAARDRQSRAAPARARLEADRHHRQTRRLGHLGAIVTVMLCMMASPASAVVDELQVRRAIDRGVAYLLREQLPNGSWPDYTGYTGGVTSICTLALLNAGVPTNDPQMQAALGYLRKLKPDKTYVLALQIMALAVAEPEKDLLIIQRNAKMLESSQVRDGAYNGAWDYSRDTSLVGGDNSNSQFALMGLYEAERVGVKISEQVWRRAHAYWRRTQYADGSWGYKSGIDGTGSMTCAGIAAMIITGEKFNQGDARVDGDRVLCCGQPESNDAIERALAWLASRFSVRSNPPARSRNWLLYYLYGIERVGRMTNHRLIGMHDWYREGAEVLVAAQEELSGFWHGDGVGETDERVATSFALLFLSKGKRPVLAAKAKFAPLDGWNRHRSDLANLTSHIESRWKREMTWQVLDLESATPQDMNLTPVLYISGDSAPQLSDRAIANLRFYIDQGGVIFAEACCESTAFDGGFRALMRRVFPEPEYRLQLLPPEHPIWNADSRVPAQFLRPLYGIEIRCRTSVVYCPTDLGCYWELSRTARDESLPPAVAEEVAAVLALGTNVMAYATNREVKDKLEYFTTEADLVSHDPFERAKLYIGKIRHAGGWNAAPGALVNLLKTVSREAGVRMSTDDRVLSFSDPALFDFHMVFMHGRNSFRLSDKEREQLRLFVERGGLVFADSVCASDEFATSFRREMAATFPDHPMRRIPMTSSLFSQEFGGFDLKAVERRDPQARDPDEPLRALTRKVEPELEGIEFGDRYGVIFSPFDLSCALERHESLECPGYTREDAARIGLNVVLYSLHQ